MKLNPIGKSYPGGSAVKNLPANAGYARDTGSVSRLGRAPGGGNGNPFQYSCLESFMGRSAWWATGISNSQTWLTMHTRVHARAHTHTYTPVGKLWKTKYLELFQQRSEEDGICIDPFQPGSWGLFLWILVPWTSGQETTMRWKKHPETQVLQAELSNSTTESCSTLDGYEWVPKGAAVERTHQMCWL